MYQDLLKIQTCGNTFRLIGVEKNAFVIRRTLQVAGTLKYKKYIYWQVEHESIQHQQTVFH
jgi:hypothetical protein